MVLNSATIAGGVGIEPCPPVLYTATPGMAEPSTSATVAVRSSSSSNLQTDQLSAPAITLLGNNLDSLSAVSAIDASGYMSPGTLQGRPGSNTATVSFPTLFGAGPWSIAASARAITDTLAGALATSGRPYVKFLPMVTLAAQFQSPNSAVDPWSPDGDLMALQGNDGLYVYDASQPQMTPRRIFTRHCEYFTWAPDGDWILCRVPFADNPLSDYSDIVAVPLSGDGTRTLISKADVGPFMWASDGHVYYWDSYTGSKHVVAAPEEWHNAHPNGFPSRTELPLVFDPLNHRRRLHHFNAELGVDSTLNVVASRAAVIANRGRFPDGERFLVWVYDPAQLPFSAIINSSGEILQALGSDVSSTGFAGTCVSADGQFILGEHIVDDGNGTIDSGLIAERVADSWRQRIDGVSRGVAPHLSHHGYLLSYTDDTTGLVHVGTLAIRLR